MPTDLTQPVIDDPNYSFAQFVWLSTRQMMVAILLRDSPWRVPTEADIETAIGAAVIEQTQASLDAARADHAAAEARTEEEWAVDNQTIHERRLAEYTRYVERQAVKGDRLSKMLAQVNAWEPPTPEHLSFKVAMVRQLTEEIDADPTPPTKKSDADHRKSSLEYTAQMVDWHAKQAKNARERVAYRKAWFEALKASVPLP